jgi:hypothetical protein
MDTAYYKRNIYYLNKRQKSLKDEMMEIYSIFERLYKQHVMYKIEMETLETKRELLKIRVAQYKTSSFQEYVSALKLLNEYDVKFVTICISWKECRMKMEYIMNTLKVSDEIYVKNAELINAFEMQVYSGNYSSMNDDHPPPLEKSKKWWKGIFRCI